MKKLTLVLIHGVCTDWATESDCCRS